MNNREYGEIVVKELQATLGAIDPQASEKFVELLWRQMKSSVQVPDAAGSRFEALQCG